MSSSDLARALSEVAVLFEELGVTYHVGGSVASSLHGLARMTLDIDIVAQVSVEHTGRLCDDLGGSYYVSQAQIEEAVARSSSFNLIHHATGMKIDVFVPPDRPFERAVAQRVVQERLEDDPEARTYPFASAEDILLNKLRWYRKGRELSDRQWNDILGIFRVQGDALDRDYLRQWAPDLGVEDLLDRALLDVAG